MNIQIGVIIAIVTLVSGIFIYTRSGTPANLTPSPAPTLSLAMQTAPSPKLTAPYTTLTAKESNSTPKPSILPAVSSTPTPTPIPSPKLIPVLIIKSILPNPTSKEQEVHLRGSGFGESLGSVVFYSSDQVVGNANIISWSDLEVKIKLPDLNPGAYLVELKTAQNYSSSRVPFTIQVGQPTAISAAGNSDKTAAILGKDFGGSSGSVFVWEDSQRAKWVGVCQIISWADSEIKCQLPSNTPLGKQIFLDINTVDKRGVQTSLTLAN